MNTTNLCIKAKPIHLLLLAQLLLVVNSYATQPCLKDQLDKKIFQPPSLTWQPHLDKGKIKALFFETLPYEAKPTRAFAYMGIPESNKKVPAMVLVHGGGGTAFHEWVKVWNDRGYAAISMSLEGHMPDSLGKGKFRHDFSGPERKGIFDDINLPLEEQWMYHAVSDIILAHSLLHSIPGIDQNRIGITGISWGGILSSLVSGLDERFKCAIPVYGCGYLDESKGHFSNFRETDPELIKKKRFWDPSNQFVTAKVPLLWVNGDSDAHFSLNCTSKSYLSTRDRAFMTIHPSMPHGHQPGWDPDRVPEIYTFADHILKNSEVGPCKIIRQPSGRSCKLIYESGIAIKRATIYYLDERLRYYTSEESKHPHSSEWLSKEAVVDTKENSVWVNLPSHCISYYVNLVDERDNIVSTRLVELEPENLSTSDLPEFKWDNIPLYLFLRKEDAFTAEELDFMSTYPVVTMAMTTGMNTWGSTEKGILEASKAVKSLNPFVKTIYYRNTLVHYNFYQVDTALDKINNPFLIDTEGNINLHRGERPLYDLSNKEVRKWWVDHVVQMSRDEKIDGVFFDGAGKVISSYLNPMIGDEKRNHVLNGYFSMIHDCCEKMDSSKIKIANLIRANFPGQGLDYLSPYDGSYLEHFDRDVQWTESSIEAAQDAARSGKVLCMTFEAGENFKNQDFSSENGYIQATAELQKRFEYCLALYLICAEKYSYFYFHDGYSVNSWTGNRFWLKKFPEYDYPLGEPLGPAKKDGNRYTREFESASISVNLADESATILWAQKTHSESLKSRIRSPLHCYFEADSKQLFVKSEREICEIRIYQTEGKLIRNEKTRSKAITLSMPETKNSIILLCVKLTDGEVITKKLFVT